MRFGEEIAGGQRTADINTLLDEDVAGRVLFENGQTSGYLKRIIAMIGIEPFEPGVCFQFGTGETSSGPRAAREGERIKSGRPSCVADKVKRQLAPSVLRSNDLGSGPNLFSRNLCTEWTL